MPSGNPEAGWEAFGASDPDITAEFWGPERPSRRSVATAWAPVVTSPFVRRLGLLAAVGLLLVPVALAVRAPQSAAPMARALAATSESTGPDAAVVIVPIESAEDDNDGDRVRGGDESRSAAPGAGETETVPDVAAGAGPGSVRMMSLPILNTPEELAAAERRATCRGSYTVRAGDSWLRIARSGQMEVAALLAANGARLEDAIHPGAELCIPHGAQMPRPPAPTTTTAPPRAASAATARPVREAPAPSTTTPPRAAAPAPRPSRAQVIDMIREVWPEELHERAFAVAHRESRYQADAYNGWCCYGVFQIYWNVHRSWMAAHGVTSSAQLLDARTNIEMAYRIYQRAGGWGPWSQ